MKNFKTLFGYELIKIWKSKITLISFLVLFLFSLIQGVMGVKGNYPEGSVELFKQIDGRTLDDDLLKELYAVADEYGSQWDETNYAYMQLCEYVHENVGYGTKVAEYDAAGIYKKRDEIIDEAKTVSMLTKEEEAYWDAQQERIVKPFIWRDAVVEKELLNSLSNVMIILALFLPLALAGLFASEYSFKTHNLLRATKNGRIMVYVAKVLAGSITALIAFSAFVGGTLFSTVLYWHLDALDAVVQIIFPFAPMNITVGELIGIMVMLLFTATLMLSASALFLSEIMHHSIAVMGTCIGGYFILFAIGNVIPNTARFLSQAFLLFPASFVSPRLVYEYRLVSVFGHLWQEYQFAPVLYIIVTAALLVIGGVHYGSKKA